MNRLSAEVVTEEIFDLYEQYGSNTYAGEMVTQTGHMAQTARLARLLANDDEVILAAFLHDIGHICAAGYTAIAMGEYGIKNHEKIGAIFLKNRGFSQKIINLVALHVSAKRYLTYKEPGYLEKITEAGRKTLFAFQNGPMNETEAADFEANPLFSTAVELRRWDDLAKDNEEGDMTDELTRIKDLMIRHLSRESSSAIQLL